MNFEEALAFERRVRRPPFLGWVGRVGYSRRLDIISIGLFKLAFYGS